MTLVQRPSTAARGWHATVAVIVLFAIVVQLILTISGVTVLVDEQTGQPPGVPERILRFFSYFTVQSNILCMLTAASLVLRPTRDGRLWRVARLDALIGISVTIVVYFIALLPIIDVTGWALVTDRLFHWVVPLATVVGWLLFGPRPRIDTRTLLLSLVWPTAYLVYVVILGEISGWYPYPFIDFGDLGYAVALRNAALVVVLLLAVGAMYRLADRRLAPRATVPPR